MVAANCGGGGASVGCLTTGGGVLDDGRVAWARRAQMASGADGPPDAPVLRAVAPVAEAQQRVSGAVETPGFEELDALVRARRAGPEKIARCAAPARAHPRLSAHVLVDVLRRLKRAFTRMHDALRAARATEHGMLVKAKRLKQDLQVRRAELEHGERHILDDTSEVGEMRRALLRGSNDVRFGVAGRRFRGLPHGDATRSLRHTIARWDAHRRCPGPSCRSLPWPCHARQIWRRRWSGCAWSTPP